MHLLLGALLLDLGDRLGHGLVVAEEGHGAAVAGLPVARLDRLEIRERKLVPGSERKGGGRVIAGEGGEKEGREKERRREREWGC